MPVISEMVWELRGGYPDVPFAEGVDTEAFTSDPDPFFVTLPFAKVDVTSRNGRKFDRAAVERMVQEVNTKRPEGRLGHVPVDKRSTDYDLPKLRWVGAMIDEDGRAWGRAWVPGYAADVREFLRDAKRANARVGLSVYGKEGEQGLRDMVLESIDLGHPDRLGVLEAASVPKITAELQEDEVGQNTQADIAEMQAKVDAQSAVIAELEGVKASVEKARAVIAEYADLMVGMHLNVNANGSDIETVIRELLEKLTLLRADDLRNRISAAVTEMVKLEKLRPVVLELLQTPQAETLTVQEARALITKLGSEGAIEKAVAEIAERDVFKSLAQALVSEVAGPAAIAGGKDKDKNKADDVVENAEKLARAKGLL